MKTIKILGTGCAKCKLTEAVIRETLGDMGIDADIEKVEDIQKIMEYDIMSTPAVVVDGVVKTTGKVPSKEDVKAMLA
jgi:small redox-active disulfide protein 2